MYLSNKEKVETFFAVVPVVRNVNEFHSLPVAAWNEVKAAC